MLCKWLFVSLFVVQCLSQLHNNGDEPRGSRETRQLGLGNVLNPTNNQQGARGGGGLPCEGPQRQKGRCLPLDQCVLRELDEDYVKHQAYLCALAPQGPVGVCCPNSISHPVPYRAGMFGNKYGARSDVELVTDSTTPQDTQLH